MKICFHTNFEVKQNYIGGTERFLVKICKELEILGHETLIVCSSLDHETYVEGIRVLGRIPEKLKSKFSQYSYFSSAFIKNEIIKDKFSIDSLKRLSSYTEEQIDGIDSDVVCLNSFAAASFLYPKKKYYSINHENEREYDSYWGEGFFELLCNETRKRNTYLHKYTKLIAPANYYAQEYSNRFNLKVDAVNLGIKLDDFLLDYSDPHLKLEYFESFEEKIILFPSRFQTKQKGHDIALKACAILRDKKIPFKLVFTGVKNSSEKYFPAFNDLVRSYNLQEYIKIITFADIQTAYKMCDIVISAEKYCSYGLSISESLSLGIPTILSDIPTYLEIANGFKHAFFFKTESAEDLANQLQPLLLKNIVRNKDEAIRFRLKYDLRKCAYKLTDLFNS